MIRVLTVCAICIQASETRTMTSNPGPGVALSLAEDRVRRLSDLRYDVYFAIPADPAARVDGLVTIRFTLTDPTRPLALDFSGSGPESSSEFPGG